MDLSYFGLVTLFTVDDFGSIGIVASLKFVGAMVFAMRVRRSILINLVFRYLASALAGTMPEFQGITFSHTLEVSAVWTEARRWNIRVTIVSEFLRGYLECSCALMLAFSRVGAADNFLKN